MQAGAGPWASSRPHSPSPQPCVACAGLVWPECPVGFPSLPLLSPAGFWSCPHSCGWSARGERSPGGSGMSPCSVLSCYGLGREYKLEGRREPFLVSIGVSEDQEKLGIL